MKEKPTKTSKRSVTFCMGFENESIDEKGLDVVLILI